MSSSSVTLQPPTRSTVPVVTDTTAASNEELEEAASYFVDANAVGPLSFARCSGGVNNKCYAVNNRDGQPLGVLRIYANGNNSARVRYEHEVLRQLQQLHTRLSPIELPCPLSPRGGSSTNTYSTMSSGAEACFFNFIKGKGPDLKSARSIGYATAKLSDVMADVKIDNEKFPRCNPIYQNLWEAHWKITEESFYDVVNSTIFEGVRNEMNFLVNEIKRLEALVVEILKEDCLPRQQLHADLHTDNCLVDEETAEVTGILVSMRTYNRCGYYAVDLIFFGHTPNDYSFTTVIIILLPSTFSPFPSSSPSSSSSFFCIIRRARSFRHQTLTVIVSLSKTGCIIVRVSTAT